MALHVRITRLQESPTVAVYGFGPGDDFEGAFTIDKRTGDVQLGKAAPCDSPNRRFLAAAAKIRKAWRAGALPEFEVHAS